MLLKRLSYAAAAVMAPYQKGMVRILYYYYHFIIDIFFFCRRLMISSTPYTNCNTQALSNTISGDDIISEQWQRRYMQRMDLDNTTVPTFSYQPSTSSRPSSQPFILPSSFPSTSYQPSSSSKVSKSSSL